MLRLILPDRRCCAFRQAMMADPATMAYNAPWFPPEGTIPLPRGGMERLSASVAGAGAGGLPGLSGK